MRNPVRPICEVELAEIVEYLNHPKKFKQAGHLAFCFGSFALLLLMLVLGSHVLFSTRRCFPVKQESAQARVSPARPGLR